MGRLEGKVAIITGGARGQGALEAELFAKEGAKVVICDILDQEGKDVEAKVLATGGDAVYSHLDVTRDDDWQEAVDLAESRYGKLDVLVNNAGIARGASIEETSEELWDEVLAVNTKGVFLGTRRAIPAMRRAGGGSIINVSSIADWGVSLPRRSTARPRAPSESSPRARPSNTPTSGYAAIPSILVPSTLRCLPESPPTQPCSENGPMKCRWAVWAAPKTWPSGYSTWPRMSLPGSPV